MRNSIQDRAAGARADGRAAKASEPSSGRPDKPGQ
jgi:hypothetical protein